MPIYIPEEAYQPTVIGLDDSGELVWGKEFKAPWHQRMFPVRYQGDFTEQWLFLCMAERGYTWEE